jgi:hypothetical protein
MEQEEKEKLDLSCKIEVVSREDSVFWREANTTKERDQLDENLRENIGLLRAATHILDNVHVIDPMVHGRVINIFEQLRALTETIDNRIEYNRTRPNI